MIVAEALTWEGTPFHHQESVKGVGCDCKGLIYGIAKTFDLDKLAGYKEDFKSYHRSIDGRQMRRLLDQYMTHKPKDDMRPGHVVWLSFSRVNSLL